LVRLKIDYGGYTTCNPQRFGQRFVGRVANPGEILLFQKTKVKRREEKAARERAAHASKSSASGLGADDLSNPAAEDAASQIQQLVSDFLNGGKEALRLLPTAELNAAVFLDFVGKDNKSAIRNHVEASLKRTQTFLAAEAGAQQGIDEADGRQHKQAAIEHQVEAFLRDRVALPRATPGAAATLTSANAASPSAASSSHAMKTSSVLLTANGSNTTLLRPGVQPLAPTELRNQDEAALEAAEALDPRGTELRQAARGEDVSHAQGNPSAQSLNAAQGCHAAHLIDLQHSLSGPSRADGDSNSSTNVGGRVMHPASRARALHAMMPSTPPGSRLTTGSVDADRRRGAEEGMNEADFIRETTGSAICAVRTDPLHAQTVASPAPRTTPPSVIGGVANRLAFDKDRIEPPAAKQPRTEAAGARQLNVAGAGCIDSAACGDGLPYAAVPQAMNSKRPSTFCDNEREVPSLEQAEELLVDTVDAATHVAASNRQLVSSSGLSRASGAWANRRRAR